MKNSERITTALVAVLIIVFAFSVFAVERGETPDSALDIDIQASESTTAATESVADAPETTTVTGTPEPTTTPPVIINIYNGQNGGPNPTAELPTVAPETTTEPAEPAIIATEIEDQHYTGNPIRPYITIKSGNKTLIHDIDYTLTYINNIKIGTATVLVEYKNPAYINNGQTRADFNIIPAEGYSGNCGKNLTWILYDTGVLTISGTGKMEAAPEWTQNLRFDIREVIIEAGATSVDSRAFYNCSSLRSVKIADSVTEIGDYAFLGCSWLEEIKLPASITKVNDYTFYDCSNLKDVNIPAGVKIIGRYAFVGCGRLESITFSDGLKEINDNAFAGCSRLNRILIPKSIKAIGPYAFPSCRDLSNVYYSGTKAQWNKIAIDASNTDLLNATIHYEWKGDLPDKFMFGDVDGNGQILASDARLALRASARLQFLSMEQSYVADVDFDGLILASDARQILRRSARLQSEFTTVTPKPVLTNGATTAELTTVVPSVNPSEFTSTLEKIRTSSDYVKKTVILNALGGESSASNKQHVVSCAGDVGDATMYTFSGVTVYTGTNGNDNVFQVDLTDSTYATANGIRVGDSVSSVVEKYGTPDFGDVNSTHGQLAYKGSGAYQTVISFTSGIVTGISITANFN